MYSKAILGLGVLTSLINANAKTAKGMLAGSLFASACFDDEDDDDGTARNPMMP